MLPPRGIDPDQYLKIVEWSEEDKCYVGTCPGLMLGGVHGKDEAKVYQELCTVVDEWVRNYQKDGDPLPAATSGRDFSGKFVVRVGKDLHRTLYLESLRIGESLNSYCVDVLCKGTGAAKQSRGKAQGAA